MVQYRDSCMSPTMIHDPWVFSVIMADLNVFQMDETVPAKAADIMYLVLNLAE
jgi:ethanolamine utilization protein EutQ (cupin superfamily)